MIFFLAKNVRLKFEIFANLATTNSISIVVIVALVVGELIVWVYLYPAWCMTLTITKKKIDDQFAAYIFRGRIDYKTKGTKIFADSVLFPSFIAFRFTLDVDV